MKATKEIVLTEKAPQPIGPYEQAVKANGMVFVSGQIPLDPATARLVGGEDVEAQTKQVMENLKAVLEKADCSFENVVRCTIFLKDMGDFPKVNAIYGSYLEGTSGCSRACVEVARLPKDVLVEIDAIAVQ